MASQTRKRQKKRTKKKCVMYTGSRSGDKTVYTEPEFLSLVKSPCREWKNEKNCKPCITMKEKLKLPFPSDPNEKEEWENYIEPCNKCKKKNTKTKCNIDEAIEYSGAERTQCIIKKRNRSRSSTTKRRRKRIRKQSSRKNH